MAELVSPSGILPHIPDHLTLAQFVLDAEHVKRPVRKNGTWIIDDQSGRKIGLEEVSVSAGKNKQLLVGGINTDLCSGRWLPWSMANRILHSSRLGRTVWLML
jgi:hypothetical protein